MVIDWRIYILRDFAHEDGRLAGREVLAINGVRAARIVEAMMEAAPGDGNAQTGRMHIIASWRFNRMLKSVVGLDSPFDLALRDVKGGRVKSEHLEGIELSK